MRSKITIVETSSNPAGYSSDEIKNLMAKDDVDKEYYAGREHLFQDEAEREEEETRNPTFLEYCKEHKLGISLWSIGFFIFSLTAFADNPSHLGDILASIMHTIIMVLPATIFMHQSDPNRTLKLNVEITGYKKRR